MNVFRLLPLQATQSSSSRSEAGAVDAGAPVGAGAVGAGPDGDPAGIAGAPAGIAGAGLRHCSRYIPDPPCPGLNRAAADSNSL